MKTQLTFVFLFVSYSCVFGQDQAMSDSLELIYANGDFAQRDRLKILNELAKFQTDLERKLEISQELISLAKAQDSLVYVFNGYVEKGNALRLKSDLSQALESYFVGAKIAAEEKMIGSLGTVYISIADVFSIMGNHDNAVKYYRDAISILREESDSTKLATALLNVGDEYFNDGKLDSALLFFTESGEIFSNLNSEMGLAYNLGNVGLVYAKMEQSDNAESNINSAIGLLTKLGDYYPICVYLTYMADIYLEKGDQETAISYAQRSLKLAHEYGLKQQISDANLKLSELYEKTGSLEKSYAYFREYVIYRDSVKNLESVQRMADLRTDFEVSQKQIEVDLLSQQKKNQRIVIISTIITSFLVFLLALGLYRRNVFMKRTNKIIEAERDRSENLLLNILPQETAEELKQYGTVKAQKFESVTVLFTDFKEFTKLVEQVDPELLLRSLDFYFKAFDEITTQYGLEKIKTIGDSYMCAAGLPTKSQTHARNVILAAKAMVAMVKNALDSPGGLIHFEMRIGVHTGPVVAGIVGIKKWQYDIWGDTVNIASRMETNSASGRVNISETTYNEIKDEFPCEYRGEIEMKNRGSLKMYFLS